MNGWSSLMRQAAVLCGLLAGGLAVALLAITQHVRALEQELTQLNERVGAERQSIQVLQAEFSFLTEPERLRRLATSHLGLTPIEPAQLGTFSSLDQPPPDASEHKNAAGEMRMPRPAAAEKRPVSARLPGGNR